MKNIFKTIGLFAVASLILTSCNEDENNTGHSMINFTPSAVQFTTAQSSYTFSENNIDSDDPTTNSIDVTISVSEPQPVDAVFEFMVSGDVNNGDIETGRVSIPAGATSATSTILINQTGDLEGNENFTITAKSLGNFTSDFNLPVTIEDDYINDALEISATWAGTYTYTPAGLPAEVTIDFCDMDFDTLLFTGAGGYIGYIAGTAACTETGSISGLADGTYMIAVDLYDNPFASLGTNQDTPITLSYSQEHFIDNTTFTFNGYNTNDAGGLKPVAIVEVKDGYKYTVTAL